MDTEGFLIDWDTQAEQRKADFMEWLYELYNPEDHTYTGLWEKYKEDIASYFRDTVMQEVKEAKEAAITG